MRTDLPQHLVKNAKESFDGKKVVANSWIEELPEGKLLAIEIERNTFYKKKGRFAGIRINENERVFVTQEEMWDLRLG